MHQGQTFRFIDYLTTQPHINDLCSHLLNDFNLSYHPERMRITWKGANHSVEVIGEYGYEENSDDGGICIGQSWPFEFWSKATFEGKEIMLGDCPGPWSDLGNVYVHRITYAHLTVGYINLYYGELTPKEREQITNSLALVMSILNLYIVFEMQRMYTAQVAAMLVPVDDHAARYGLLSLRQISILKLIGKGKTNAQIGRELGYATTTIHAECSDIYRLLGVGTRTSAFALVSHLIEGKQESEIETL